MRQLNLVAAMTVEALVERDLCRKNASSLFDQPTQTHFIADGAFDWDGYALVGIAPGLYKKETGGRREGSCAVRWQSLQENFPATRWRRIQVWVRRDAKAKADWPKVCAL